jgi:hypothetical protein
VKIGYQAGIKLLRCRRHADRHHPFPARRGARGTQPNRTSPTGATGSRCSASTCATPPASRRSASHLLATRDRLDFIVNNACQTVRRPPEFYRHMMAGETAALDDAARRTCERALLGRGYEGLRGSVDLLPEARSVTRPQAPRRMSEGSPSPPALTRAAELSQVPLLAEDCEAQAHLFPEGRLDQDLQQVDLRGRNSWRLQLARGVVGRAARSAAGQRGGAVRAQRAAQAADAAHARARQAHRQRVGGGGAVLPRFKTTKHPHTNMAKAALNMMTRTSAADYHATAST